MKMIDVLNLMAEEKIEEDTKLITSTDLDDYEYRYSTGRHAFFDKYLAGIEADFFLDKDFLNLEVELRTPKEKKYRIKLPHSQFCVCLVKTKDNEKEIMPYIKDSQIIEALIQGATEKGLEFQTEFTEQDFEEIKELKPYEQFKEPVKDDENE